MTLATLRTAARKQAEFFRKGWLAESSHAGGFAVRILGSLVPLVFFYFLSKLVDPRAEQLTSYRGGYFAFAAIGTALTQYSARASGACLRELRSAQLSGVLEACLSTRTRPSAVMIYEAIYNHVFALLHLMVVGGAAVLWLGLDVSKANWVAAAGGFVLLVAALVATTLITSALVIWTKSLELGQILTGGLTAFVAGAYVPVTLFPAPVQWLADLLPLKHALDVLRLSLLAEAEPATLAVSVAKLAILTAFLCAGGGWFLSWTVRRARRDGTLGHH